VNSVRSFKSTLGFSKIYYLRVEMLWDWLAGGSLVER
jgi:hypothetical protein